MKTRTRYLASGFLLAFALSHISCVQEKESSFTWNDGFLDRSYAVTQSALDAALSKIFVKTVAQGTTVLEEEKGIIRRHGVGDRNEKWGSWSGVSTIPELKINEGGVVIAVKTISGAEAIIVGFKVGEGDRGSSEVLHGLLLARLGDAPSPK